MKVHNLISKLLEYDPDAEVIVVCPSGKELDIEDVDLADTQEVVIELVDAD